MMLLDCFCAACAICAWASAGSVRLRSCSRCCSATWLASRPRPGIGGDGAVVLVRHRHVGLARPAPAGAAGDAGHGAEVVVADPHAGHQRAGEADEPGVAMAGAGAGLAGDGGEVERGVLGRAVRDHRPHHRVHVLGDLAAHDLRRLGLVLVARVDELALGVEHLEDGVGLGELAAVGEGGVGAGVLQRRDAGVAERHRAGLLDADHAEALGHLHHLLAADPQRHLDGGHVERHA